MNIFSIFFLNKLVTFDDSNPPWMNDFTKNKIMWKHKIIGLIYIKNGHKDSDYVKFQESIIMVSEVINRHKEEY